MSSIKIGLQLYSVREFFEKDVEKCFVRVKEIGYEAIELYGPFKYPAQKIKALAEKYDLEICGYHTALNALSDDMFYATVAYNQIISNKNIIVPIITEDMANSKEQYNEKIEEFKKINSKLNELGLNFGYHAHAVDFRNVEGEMPWDMIISKMPNNFIMQLDTANSLCAGLNPVDILNKYPHMSKTIHYKPYSKTTQYDSMICEDDLNWEEIIKATKEIADCEYIIVEHETIDENMEHAEQCYKNIKKLLKK